VLLHADCPIARSEGLSARAQVELNAGGQTALATLYQVAGDLLGVHEVGLSEVVWRRLQVTDGTPLLISHPKPLHSMSAVRAKVYGHRLDETQLCAPAQPPGASGSGAASASRSSGLTTARIVFVATWV